MRQRAEQLDFEVIVGRSGSGTAVEVTVVVIGGGWEVLLLLGELAVFERGHGLIGVGEGIGAGEHHGGEVLEAVAEEVLLLHAEGLLVLTEGWDAVAAGTSGTHHAQLLRCRLWVDVVGAAAEGVDHGTRVLVGYR